MFANSRVILTLQTATALILATPASAQMSQMPLAKELLQIEAERQQAYAAGDGTTLERQLAAEYVHTNLRGERTDRSAELAFYSPDAFSLRNGRIEAVAVHRYGDVATLTGTVFWEGAAYSPAPGVMIDLSGRYSVSRVYIRRTGRWQLALSHASQAAPSK